MEDKTDRLAGELYNRYCVAVGGKAFNNDPLPPWTEFSIDPQKQKQADAWRVLAMDLLSGQLKVQ